MHTLKIYPRFARAILTGRKTWEYRREDGKRFYVGENLFLIVVGEKSHRPTGKEIRARVTYLHRGWPIPDGHICMTIRVMETSTLGPAGRVMAANRIAECGEDSE